MMPVIKHYDGNCHVYVDAEADVEMAAGIVENAKCQRMGVCNACESLLVHEAIAELAFLPKDGGPSSDLEKGDGNCVRMTERVKDLLPGREGRPPKRTGTRNTWARSSASRRRRFARRRRSSTSTDIGSHHTDAIVTRRPHSRRRCSSPRPWIPSAVMVNASTRFNDGGVFGLGRRDRHLDRQVPRPRTLRYRRTDQLQVRGARCGPGSVSCWRRRSQSTRFGPAGASSQGPSEAKHRLTVH